MIANILARVFGADDLPIKVQEFPGSEPPFYTLQFGDDTHGVLFFCETAQRAEMAAKLRAAADEIEKPIEHPAEV